MALCKAVRDAMTGGYSVKCLYCYYHSDISSEAYLIWKLLLSISAIDCLQGHLLPKAPSRMEEMSGLPLLCVGAGCVCLLVGHFGDAQHAQSRNPTRTAILSPGCNSAYVKRNAYACNFCTELLHCQLMLFRNELLLHNVRQNNKYTLATYHKSDNYNQDILTHVQPLIQCNRTLSKELALQWQFWLLALWLSL